MARAVDQRVLEQVQGEHRGFLEVAMLAVLAFVILAIAIALYLRRRGVVDRTDPSYVEGYTPASLVDVVV